MDTLSGAIENAAAALKAITPLTLTPQQLESSLRVLKATDVHALIDELMHPLLLNRKMKMKKKLIKR